MYSITVKLEKGSFLVKISIHTTPKLQTSVLTVKVLPVKLSGAIHLIGPIFDLI